MTSNRSTSTKAYPARNKPETTCTFYSKETQPVILRKLLVVQVNKNICTQEAQTIGLLNFTYNFLPEGALIVVSPIDDSAQQYIATTFRPCIFHLYH